MDNRVYLARTESYDLEAVRASVHACFEAFGGAKKLCGGKKVVVKPNLLLAFSPDAAATTHPSVVQAVCEELAAAGCTVTIAESAGGASVATRQKRLYAVTGIEQAAKASGANLPTELESRQIRYPEGKVCNAFLILNEIADAEYLIDIGKFKTHCFMYHTGAVKNMFGSIPGLNKPLMHSYYPDKAHFAGMIADLCELVHPDFCILDGVIGMEGHGPSGGSPKKANVILAAVNPYAADLAAMDIMGLDPAKSPIFQEGVSRGHAPAKLSGLSLSGEPIEHLRTRFVPPDGSMKTMHPLFPKPLRKLLDGHFKVYPKIQLSKCIGCGECAKTCPQHTITVQNGKASVNYRNCIRCYCCHELCPRKAITFTRKRNFSK